MHQQRKVCADPPFRRARRRPACLIVLWSPDPCLLPQALVSLPSNNNLAPSPVGRWMMLHAGMSGLSAPLRQHPSSRSSPRHKSRRRPFCRRALHRLTQVTDAADLRIVALLGHVANHPHRHRFHPRSTRHRHPLDSHRSSVAGVNSSVGNLKSRRPSRHSNTRQRLPQSSNAGAPSNAGVMSSSVANQPNHRKWERRHRWRHRRSRQCSPRDSRISVEEMNSATCP